jgi:hypothetical protein
LGQEETIGTSKAQFMVAQFLIIQKFICFANKANSFELLNVEFLTCVDING